MMRLLLTAAALAPCLVMAGEKIDELVDVAADGKIYIENQRGDVKILAWDKAQLKISGELDDKATGYKLETHGDRTEFRVKTPKRLRNGDKDDGSKLTIYMPAASALAFEGVTVDVTAENLKGGVSIETVNGDIDVKKLSGELRFETVNGDVVAKDLEGRIKYETVNGDIRDTDSKGVLRFEAVNGDIRSKTEAEDVKLENVNGDINFEMARLKFLGINTVNGEMDIKVAELADNARINIESVSGDADIVFPSGVSARFEIEAHAGGKIINDITNDKASKAKYGPSSSLKFTSGQGDADVEIDTISGRIRLKTN